MTEPRQCVHCQRVDSVPNIMPYLAPERGHIWAHPQCMQQMIKLDASRNTFQHEHGDCV